MKTLIKIAAASWLAGNLLILHAHAGETDDKHITVFKTPWCGCCQVWVDAVEKAGYTVETKDMEDLSSIKTQAGVPAKLEACHTAAIGGDRKYVLEGHVPLAAISKLMTEQPDIRGISTPGMPMGSLGMGEDPKAKYDVLAFTVFGVYGLSHSVEHTLE